MLHDNLLNLGFSPNESTIYLALFNFGKIKAGELIIATGLHRNIVYTSLDSLVERQLVTKTIIKGVAHFVVNNPEALVSEIDNKKQLAKQMIKELHKKIETTQREVIIYEGLEGIKRIHEESLNSPTGTTFYMLGAPSFGVQEELNKYWQNYHKKRIKRGINFLGMYDKSVDEDILLNRNNLELCEVKYLPQDFDMPMWIYIVNDVCSLITAKENPLIINIKSKEIAKAFLQYFNYLWDQTDSKQKNQ
ncbi:MAG: Transcriptional regulator, TrmB [uncultured bacterium]|nr:MAG: Transcriptional regulator, TrmB [uncultured bacterium]OGH89634.1 MAG: hypothetical protein A2507_00885 [Candidatus Magasanikbacteria bacterium RIFOXYD12_FULL_33_17]HAO52353.1 hypothetical protein [Candidatus Magasanikbacteria bacterium]